MGDAILKNFVAIMHEAISPRAVFRFGGDEFSILDRNISVEEMLSLADQALYVSKKTKNKITEYKDIFS